MICIIYSIQEKVNAFIIVPYILGI
jgi:hypothetical protein